MSHRLKEFLLPLSHTFSDLINGKNESPEWTGVVCFLIIREHIVLIRRSEEMPTHRGQMALIGGHKKYDETILETALREYYEELSLKLAPNFIGFLPPVYTTLKNKIIPVVCEVNLSVEEFLEKARSNGEWNDLFMVPLETFYDLNQWGHGMRIQNDSKPIFFFPIKAYTYQSHSGKNDDYQTLWGATAQMLMDFISKVPKNAVKEK